MTNPSAPGANRREAILRATLSVVRAEGWRAISMRRVADQTGVTATALCRHFANKADLVDHAAAAASGVLQERLTAAMSGAPSREAGSWFAAFYRRASWIMLAGVDRQ